MNDDVVWMTNRRKTMTGRMLNDGGGAMEVCTYRGGFEGRKCQLTDMRVDREVSL